LYSCVVIILVFLLQLRYEEAKASELIDIDLKIWNQGIVQQVFNAYEANHMDCIPLTLRLPNDKLI